jgi:hypothetical protein
MALSNIRREPQREITESAVGLVIFGLFMWADYEVALWMIEVGPPHAPPVPIVMILASAFLLGGVGLLVGIILVTHQIGDAVCNALERNGLHLRPRVRK